MEGHEKPKKKSKIIESCYKFLKKKDQNAIVWLAGSSIFLAERWGRKKPKTASHRGLDDWDEGQLKRRERLLRTATGCPSTTDAAMIPLLIRE